LKDKAENKNQYNCKKKHKKKSTNKKYRKHTQTYNRLEIPRCFSDDTLSSVILSITRISQQLTDDTQTGVCNGLSAQQRAATSLNRTKHYCRAYHSE